MGTHTGADEITGKLDFMFLFQDDWRSAMTRRARA